MNTPLVIGLIGNPNCGKSTCFNALTGSNQKVGNWPGVTVDRKSGQFEHRGQQVEVIDLPGIYSLTSHAEEGALDARIACQEILSGELDVLVNIVDASNLERHLYLTTQLLAMHIPVIVAVNMMDVIATRGWRLDLERLSQQLGCPVVGVSAFRKQGLQSLKDAIINCASPAAIQHNTITYPAALTDAAKQIAHQITEQQPDQAKMADFLALHSLESDNVIPSSALSADISQLIKTSQQTILTSCGEEADLLIADARYTTAHNITNAVLEKSSAVRKTVTQRLDQIILNRFLGVPIFLVSMYLMFFISINIGGALQPFFDQASDAIFVHGLAQLLTTLGVPNSVTVLVALGLGKGINTVVTFIPVIGFLFLWLAFLESSGYMARAAFVIDRVMQKLGLPGKSFVPLIIGFGCNVPAILAARTLENRRDRLLTLMMMPFMSCGARLAIYAVFITAFFPVGGQNVVFVLYLIGILMAVFTGWALRNTVLKGESSPWIMELPTYHWPTLTGLLLATWQRLKQFLFTAGKYIIPVCLLVSALNSFSLDGRIQPESGSTESLLSMTGKAITPAFAPMGITQDNWPATVGLATGILAKEVVVGTLNTLYSDVGHLAPEQTETFDFTAAMKAAALTVPTQLAQLSDSLSNPIAASSADASMADKALGVMYQHFDGQIGAMAYLLFILLYFPCISATAALARESSRRWAVFSVFWTTGLAYVVAVVFYQLGTWLRHPFSSTLWVVALGGAFIFALLVLRYLLRLSQQGELQIKLSPAKNSVSLR